MAIELIVQKKKEFKDIIVNQLNQKA